MRLLIRHYFQEYFSKDYNFHKIKFFINKLIILKRLMDHSMRIVRLETIKLINIISKKEISEINKLLN